MLVIDDRMNEEVIGLATGANTSEPEEECNLRESSESPSVLVEELHLLSVKEHGVISSENPSDHPEATAVRRTLASLQMTLLTLKRSIAPQVPSTWTRTLLYR